MSSKYQQMRDRVGMLTYLRIVKPEKNGEWYEKSCPDIDCFDTQIGSIRTDHVRDCPLEDNTGLVLVRSRSVHTV